MNRSVKSYDPFVRSHRALALLFLFVCVCVEVQAQQKQSVQVKTFDQKLQVFRNVEVSINGREYVAIGEKGVAFTELNAQEQIRSVAIKNETLEAASWNFSKGVVEIIIRPKSHKVVALQIRNQDAGPVAHLPVIFEGSKTIKATSDANGKFEIPLSLEEKVISGSQFKVDGYHVVGLQGTDNGGVLTIERLKTGAETAPKQSQPEEYFRNFDLSKLDSIQSLTAFYAIFKRYPMNTLSEEARRKIDEKFNQLVSQHEDSLKIAGSEFMGKISDSSLVGDDIRNLLSQAQLENSTLDGQRSDFDEKIRMINEKLTSGYVKLDANAREQLVTDLTLLEKLLTENESRFYKNQNDYRQIINALKEKFLDVQNLENRLSESEAQRLEEQRVFQQKLLAISVLVIVFGVLIILLIQFSARLRKQKKSLIEANAEVQRINENLESIVEQRTRLLAEANRELDTFLYRASHDLRSPVRSIFGLCNIGEHLSQRELVDKVMSTTQEMDRLLKSLSVISEINQPSNYSSITLLNAVEDVRQKFSDYINAHQIQVQVSCPADLVFFSYPNLIDVILTNLFENALFFSSLQKGIDARIEFKADYKNDGVEFSVFDNGIGIGTEIRQRLFDMFYKGHEESKGNGLGLYIVQKSVQALNGSIRMESEVGKYTKFIVELPLTVTTSKELV
jgi:signal transduction histidine kinase